MYHGGYDSGHDGIHFVDTSTGTHLKSFYWAYSYGGDPLTNWGGGTVEMFEDKILWIANTLDPIQTMTIFYDSADNAEPNGKWAYYSTAEKMNVYGSMQSTYDAKKIYCVGSYNEGLYLGRWIYYAGGGGAYDLDWHVRVKTNAITSSST
jgi:hypothetical protein